MIELHQITARDEDLVKVEKLYQTSFPDDERMPFGHLLLDSRREIEGIYEDGVFCGFISLFTFKFMTYIAFFAVEMRRRGNGIGSVVLELVHEAKPDNILFLDIEAIEPTDNESSLRVRRKRFYLNNGFRESGIRYTWNNVAYENMVRYGELTPEMFETFWQGLMRVNHHQE